MELFLLYLWFKLNAWIIFSWIVFGCLVAFLGAHWVYRHDSGSERVNIERHALWKQRKVPFYTLTVVAFLSAFFTPSAKETAVLVIASYASDLAKSPEGVKAWTLIRKTANNMLDDALKAE